MLCNSYDVVINVVILFKKLLYCVIFNSRIFGVGKKSVFQKVMKGDGSLRSCARAFTTPGTDVIVQAGHKAMVLLFSGKGADTLTVLRHTTLDAILALRLLTEVHREFQQPLYVAFVDLKAAFDSVDRTALWKAMRGIGVPSILLDLIIDLHTATFASVRVAGHLSTSFTTTSGVRQGCVLAPALFCRAMDIIMKHVSRKAGIQVGQHTFIDIDYADVALLVDKEENFCSALSAMEDEASKFGLHVSWTKTKIQNLGLGPTPSPVTVNGNTVVPV